jgi:hypothetical protein
MRNILIRILTKLLQHLTKTDTLTTEDITSDTKVVFCKPFTEEDVYNKSDDIDSFINKIQQINGNRNQV